MEIINDPEKLLDLYFLDKWKHRDINPYISSDYSNGDKALTFECGCGEDHILRNTNFYFIATPVKFIFNCNNDYLTAVRVKGLFFQKAISKWSCKKDILSKALELTKKFK